MRRLRLQSCICALVAVALLVATSHYLAHFHLKPAGAVATAQAEPGDDAGHGVQEHCGLCVQFDRLPAPPATDLVPVAYFFLVATVEAQRLESMALDAPLLWPPSRGPPSLA